MPMSKACKIWNKLSCSLSVIYVKGLRAVPRDVVAGGGGGGGHYKLKP